MKAATGKQLGTQEDAGRVKAPSRRPTTEEIVAGVREHLGDAWPPRIYRERVLPLRTRSHAIPPATKGATVEVQHTLLGVELKVGRRRISCPDYATARYLAVFARAGCGNVAVPYDITKISSLADELESAWQRMLLFSDHSSGGRGKSFSSRVRAVVVKEVREEIESAGAGTAIPQFNQNTSQRRRRIS
ncbi:MAG: hypothetical protein LC754_15235 [Acidobacteria bacterium]|nr:hypothetical protein [Acidobacteriota bacterium]